MNEAMTVIINGQKRPLEGLTAPAALASVVEVLELKGDRIAVELDGAIVPRTGWGTAMVAEGSRLEIVHFVGGGVGGNDERGGRGGKARGER